MVKAPRPGSRVIRLDSVDPTYRPQLGTALRQLPDGRIQVWWDCDQESAHPVEQLTTPGRALRECPQEMLDKLASSFAKVA